MLRTGACVGGSMRFEAFPGGGWPAGISHRSSEENPALMVSGMRTDLLQLGSFLKVTNSTEMCLEE